MDNKRQAAAPAGAQGAHMRDRPVQRGNYETAANGPWPTLVQSDLKSTSNFLRDWILIVALVAF